MASFGPVHAALVGSINTDLVTRAPVIPAPGETVMGSSFTVGFGGKGANQGVILARLSAAVSHIGAVGDDSFGRDAVLNLSSAGVDTAGVEVVREAGVSTGCAPIWVSERDGENSIIVVPGANLRVGPAERVRAAVARVGSAAAAAGAAGGAAGVGYPAVFAVVCQNEINLDATAAALEAGAAAGALTVLTPAPAPPEGTFTPSLLSRVSVLVPNAHEAAAIAGGARAAAGAGADSAPPSPPPPPSAAVERAAAAASSLLAMGCGAVVITLGKSGALVAVGAGAGAGAGEGAGAFGEGGPVHVPGVHVARVVDTTGAGDAFSGALAYFTVALMNAGGAGGEGGGVGPATGSPCRPPLAVLVEAARRACYVAADSVAREGTQSSYSARAGLPDALFGPGLDGSAAAEALRQRPL